MSLSPASLPRQTGKKKIVKKSSHAAVEQDELDSEYSVTSRKFEETLRQCFLDGEASIKEGQQAQLDELRRLVTKKLELEEALARTSDELRQAYAEARMILQVVVVGKIQDVEAGISATTRGEVRQILWD